MNERDDNPTRGSDAMRRFANRIASANANRHAANERNDADARRIGEIRRYSRQLRDALLNAVPEALQHRVYKLSGSQAKARIGDMPSPVVNEDVTKCSACGYPFEGLPRRGKCPECGTAYHYATVQHWRSTIAELAADGDTRCPECKYDLTGLPVSGRCPECGKNYVRSADGHELCVAVAKVLDLPPESVRPSDVFARLIERAVGDDDSVLPSNNT